MAEPSDIKGVDNNWVMASPEGFVVETLGHEQDLGTAVNGGPAGVSLLSHDTESHPTGEYHESTMGPQKEEAKEAEATIAPATFPQTEAVPVNTAPDSAKLDIPPDKGLPAEADLKAPSLARKAEDASESSSEDDVEGLRKRQVRPVSRMAEPDRDMQAETDSWLTLNRCIMAALALVGLGLLVVAGTGYDADDDVLENLGARDVGSGEQPTPQTVAEIKHWITEHADAVTGDPQPLHAMNDVLDRLAKENQDIRRMQAELQAQKKELQALLSKSEGEKISVGSKQKNLLEENIRLKELLLQEETAHLSVQAELQAIKEKLQGLDPATFLTENANLKAERDLERLQIEGFLVQKETLVAEAQMLRQELDKQRTLLTSIRQEMENVTNNSSSLELGADVLQLKEILEGIGSKLKSELQRSETWEKNYVKDKEQKQERDSYSKKGRNPLEDDVVFPNTSVSPSSTSGSKVEGSKQPYRSTASTLKESMRGILNSDNKEKLKEFRDWKESKHSKHVHAEGEGQWPHKKHHHHHREGGNDPQEHKVPEFDGRKNEWKGIPKDGKWKDRGEAWRERSGHHHNIDAEKKREDEKHHERPENDLPHHREHRGAFQDGKHLKNEGAQQNRPQWEKQVEAGKKEHRHHDHNRFWKKLSDHQYRVPEGCTSVADCARKEGLDLFNKELAPVDKLEFQQLLREYLELQELAKYLPELDNFMSSFFEGDTFMHDRMRFRDFVDDVEDYLEDVAAKEKGDDDAVDDFDKHIFKHYFGEAAVKRRFSKKAARKIKPLPDSEEMGSETLHEGPKHVKTEQGVKERRPNKQHKHSNLLNEGTGVKEQLPGQENNSKLCKHDQQNKDRWPNTEHKSHSTEGQTHHHHKPRKDEVFEERQPGHLNDNDRPSKYDKERPSEHRPSDPKPIKNEKNLQKRKSGHGHSDCKQLQQEKTLNEAQFDNEKIDSKASRNEKHAKEPKSYHSHNVNHEKRSNKRHSNHESNSEKQSHGHRDLKHEKQSHGDNDDSEREVHRNERWSHHDLHHSEHGMHPSDREPGADQYHSKHETCSKDRGSHYDHCNSKHEKHSNKKKSHGGRDNSEQAIHLNERQSHHGHHKSRQESPFNGGRAHRDHHDSKYEKHSNEKRSHRGHYDSEHEKELHEKQNHHGHQNPKHEHSSNERWSHHDHHKSKHEKNKKESWSQHRHQGSKHEKYPSQRQSYYGQDDAKPEKYDQERQFKTSSFEPKALKNEKSQKERENYHFHGDSKSFADKKQMKDDQSYKHHHNNIKTSHKEANTKTGKHRHEHGEHSDSKNTNHIQGEGSTYQNYEDGNSFHHKELVEKNHHHHSGSEAFSDERPSPDHYHDWHKHDHNEGHHKGPGKDKAYKEGHK